MQISSDPKLTLVLQKQLNTLSKMQLNDIKVILNDDPYDLQADITGPTGTPYEGGVFRVKLQLTSDFPQTPPKGYFTTKIFHPNVNHETGEICVNTLKRDWDSQSWNLKAIYEVIRCLLIVPFPESALNQEAAKMFMESYQEYFDMAKMLTNLNAIKNNNILQDNSSIVNNQKTQNIPLKKTINNQNQKKWIKRI